MIPPPEVIPMSKRLRLRATLLFVACVSLPIGSGHASAQEITIDRGYVWMYAPNPVFALTVGGTRGFTFRLDRDRPVLDTFGPLACSGQSGCPYGAVVDLAVRWRSSIRGQATLDGALHPHVGDADTLAVELSGSVVLPEPREPREVTAPFTLSGTFSTGSAALSLGGAGTAIVYLSENPARDGWVINRVDYNFDRALPEPW